MKTITIGIRLTKSIYLYENILIFAIISKFFLINFHLSFSFILTKTFNEQNVWHSDSQYIVEKLVFHTKQEVETIPKIC